MMRKLSEYGTIILLLLSVSLNVGLAFKIRSLTNAVNPGPLSIGTHINGLEAQDLTGKSEQIRFGSNGESTVLYVFSPTCHWCAKNLDNVKELYKLEHNRFSFLGISLGPDDVPQYISQTGFPLSVVKNPSQDTIKELHLAGTPETIVIDSTGVVSEVWDGAYRPSVCRGIEKFFDLPPNTLSGI